MEVKMGMERDKYPVTQIFTERERELSTLGDPNSIIKPR